MSNRFAGLRKAVHAGTEPTAAARLGAAGQGAQAPADDPAATRPDDGRPASHDGRRRQDRQPAPAAQDVRGDAAAADDGGRRPRRAGRPLRTAIRPEVAERALHDQAGDERGARCCGPDEKHAAIRAAVQPELHSEQPKLQLVSHHSGVDSFNDLPILALFMYSSIFSHIVDYHYRA